VAFCDEFHFGIGPQITKRIKRRKGSASRYKGCNVQRKKVTSKDTKAKAREEGSIKLFSIFAIIGFDYKKLVMYEVPNKVGKMTTDVYIKHVLPTILDDFRSKGLTLYQDKDSAHNSRATRSWAKKHGLSIITGPGNSPDFSIIESQAQGLKRKFHSRRCTTEKAALARFTRIFEEELDQKKVQKQYEWYTKRFHECRRLDGQMTRY
jgi:hypothetical protein